MKFMNFFLFLVLVTVMAVMTPIPAYSGPGGMGYINADDHPWGGEGGPFDPGSYEPLCKNIGTPLGIIDNIIFFIKTDLIVNRVSVVDQKVFSIQYKKQVVSDKNLNEKGH